MHFSRRDLLKLFAASSASIVVSSGLNGCNDSSSSSGGSPSNDASENSVSFHHGVASGDPLSDRVILWTRATPALDEAVTIQWEVAEDANFLNLVNTDSASVDASTDFTLKVDVMGLTPGQRYFYRFKHGDTVSETGQTNTLPSTTDKIKLAVFSCANYPAGYFHVYADAASRANELDAIIHLGDYIYEYDIEGYPDAGSGETINRVHQPTHECIQLEDYRTRYAQYRSDADLQNLHAQLPFICVWDDHEIANDTYDNGAENHDEQTEGDFFQRRAAAIQAWYEWLPVRAPEVDADKIKTYRQFDFGSLVSLMMLDTRVVGRNKQLDYADYMDVSGQFDIQTFSQDLVDSDRSILGEEQKNWVLENLIESKASGTTWQVLGQQVLMAKMLLPASIIMPDPQTGLPNPQNLVNYQTAANAYQELAEAVITTLTQNGILNDYAAQIDGFASLSPTQQGIALTEAVKASNTALYGEIFAQLPEASQTALQTYGDLLNPSLNPSIPYNLDAWDGYAAEREILLQTAKAYQSNLIVLAGDTHNAWCSRLIDQNGDLAGVEFATSSVSSPGMEKYLSIPMGYEASTESGIESLVEDLQYFNSSQRGYMVVTFTADAATAQWYMMPREAEKSEQRPNFSVNKQADVLIDSLNLELS